MSLLTKLVSPVDGSVVVERAFATLQEISTALSAAAIAQEKWKALTIDERAVYCLAMVDAMVGMKDEIVTELAWQMGRPIRYGAGEVRGFEERARHMISIASDSLADIEINEKAGFKRYIRREPLGIVLVVAPWNYPYLTAVNSIIPALMAGNAVILKHASQTLLVGERFAKACQSANFPSGLFCNIVLDHEQTASVIGSGRVHQVNFTGSVGGGKAMEAAAVGCFLGMGLELGGKDPAYVRADADINHAVENLVDGSFFNSGQSCCGIERIYVDKKIYPEFIERFVALTNSYILGSPLDETTTLGPVIKPAAAEFVRGQIKQAIEMGATALIDPGKFPANKEGTAYLAPQVLVNVNHQMSVMRDESFGPVVGIMSVDNDAQAIELMNDSEFGLTASIWTKDLAAAEIIGDQIQTGTVFMNRCDALDPALVWTGVKNTGRGATLSRVGYETLTRPKSFHLRYEI